MKKRIKKFFKKIKKKVLFKKFNKRKAFYFLLILIAGFIICYILAYPYNNMWTRNGDVISKGKEVYHIGDYYDYDETSGGKIKDLVDVNWKVLGVENGKLLLISSDNTFDLTLGSETDLVLSQDDYINGQEKIEEICKKYSYGKDAVGARSVNRKDIINSFNINSKYVKPIYGEYTYYWGSDNKLISIDQNDIMEENSMYNRGMFVWFNEKNNRWETVVSDASFTDENMKKIVTVKDDLIALNSVAWDEELKEYVNLFDGSEKKKLMLFKNENGENISYWTTDRFTHARGNFIGYGYNAVKGDSLNYAYLVYSLGKTRENTHGVRVVVMIK